MFFAACCIPQIPFNGEKELLISSYNKSQQDALFLNFIVVKNPTCFRQTYCPWSGVLILYSQQLLFVILVMLTVCEPGQDGGICHTSYVDCLLVRSGWRYLSYYSCWLSASEVRMELFVIPVMLTVCQTVNTTNMTNTNCCVYSIKTPDDGQ
jgi:hypothetical protein